MFFISNSKMTYDTINQSILLSYSLALGSLLYSSFPLTWEVEVVMFCSLVRCLDSLMFIWATAGVFAWFTSFTIYTSGFYKSLWYCWYQVYANDTKLYRSQIWLDSDLKFKNILGWCCKNHIKLILLYSNRQMLNK